MSAATPTAEQLAAAMEYLNVKTQAIEEEQKKQRETKYQDIRSFFPVKKEEKKDVPEVEKKDISIEALNGIISSGSAGNPQDMVKALLSKITALEEDLQKARASTKEKLNGPGAIFPPRDSKFFVVPKDLCRGSADTTVVAGEEALRGFVTHGTELSDPKIIRFEQVIDALTYFFETNPKKFVIQIRR
jgi:hypothetical protein